MNMRTVPRYYSILFNGVTKVLQALEQRNYGTAERILARAQIQAEGAFMDGGEAEEPVKMSNGYLVKPEEIP